MLWIKLGPLQVCMLKSYLQGPQNVTLFGNRFSAFVII